MNKWMIWGKTHIFGLTPTSETAMTFVKRQPLKVQLARSFLMFQSIVSFLDVPFGWKNGKLTASILSFGWDGDFGIFNQLC